LGETFDIHGGGLDLVFPHHENEIAQSECCHGQPFATYWAHNGLLRRDAAAGKIGGRAERESAHKAGDGIAGPEDAVSGKMSRSKGAGGLAQLIAHQGGERVRFFLLRTHYRSTVLFSEPAIEEAGVGLETFYRLFKRYHRITASDFYEIQPPTRRAGGGEVASATGAPLEAALQAAHQCKQKFLAAMDDDFNTGGAIAELFELAKIANRYCDEHNLEAGGANQAAFGALTLLLTTLKELSNILGLFLQAQQPPAQAGGSADAETLSQVMQLVIDLRAEARQAKNFATADAIRDGLAPTGIKLEDRAGGTEWTGSAPGALDAVMHLLIQLRQTARQNKDFATADAIRHRLASFGVALEDRAGGTEWTRT
jgi:cysteinyl-tRNA synthetase